MAEVWIMSEDGLRGVVGYNINDGKPHGLQLGDKVWLDTWGYPADRPIIEEEGWQEKLVEVVKFCELDNPEGRRYGLGAYIYWMQEQGLLPAGDK